MSSLTRRQFVAGSAAAVATVAGLANSEWAAGAVSPFAGAAATILDGQLVVSALTTAAARLSLRAWPVDDPGNPVTSPAVSTNAALAAELAVPIDDRAWSWQVVTGSGATSPVATVPARPAGAEPFTFAFGCCATYNTDLIPSLDLVARSDAKFMAFIGDLGYVDGFGEQTYSRYVSEFRRWIGVQLQMRSIGSRMPFYFVGDDHDYGRDGAIGVGGADGANPEAVRAYDDVLPGTLRQGGVSYRRWSLGGVDFFLLDNRRYATSRAAMLGPTQLNWLTTGLSASPARLKVIFAPMTPTWYWPGGDTATLLNTIANKVSGLVLTCSGDKHANAFVRMAPRTYEMLCGPLRNPVKHLTPQRPYSILWTEGGIGGRSLSNAVGFVRVAGDQVALTWRKEDGSVVHAETLSVP